jgi:Putative beta-lactamase-inhibitor-like, PepSY-like
MKPGSIFLFIFLLVFRNTEAQDLETREVPSAVKSALQSKYPEAKVVKWEKEKGNFEANWGGKSGEDNSVQFTPGGQFIEIVKAIPVNELPKAVKSYVKEHFNNAKISEAGRVTDAKGKLFFEAEIHGKDLIFDSNGDFLKND